MAEPGPTLRELVAGLKESVDKLANVAASNTADVARTRRGNVLNSLALVAVIVFVAVYYFIELPSRRQGIEDKINNLACVAVEKRPPGYSSTYDRIRRDYSCPPYVPGTTPDTPGQATTTVPAPSSSRTPSTKTVTPGAQGPLPTSTTTMTATRTSYVLKRPPAVTITRQMPAVTRTERVTVTVAPRCVVLRLICP